jgi:hypothetical protein
MYVIQRVSDHCYVSKPGSRCRYTPLLHEARVFVTRKAAEENLRPENETITDAISLLRFGH